MKWFDMRLLIYCSSEVRILEMEIERNSLSLFFLSLFSSPRSFAGISNYYLVNHAYLKVVREEVV